MAKRFRTVWSSLVQFVGSPTDGRHPGKTNVDKLKDVLCLIGIQFLLLIPASMIVGLLEEFGNLNLPDHKLEEFFQDAGPAMMILMGVILAPLLEELIFRTFITLRRFYPLLFFIASGNRKNQNLRIRKVFGIWKILFPVLVYVSAVLFGYVHVFNFEDDISLWKAPFAVLPQLILGFTLAFTRVRYGLVWSMLNHAIWNLIPISILIAFPDIAK